MIAIFKKICLFSLVLVSLLLLLSKLSYAHTNDGTVGSKVIVVEMTHTGFVPNKIELQQGDTIIFKNVDKIPHWPASNPHSNYLVYPEFDSKVSVQPGRSWKFTFEKVGKWRFYDHLEPFQLGEVIVKKNPNYKGAKNTLNAILPLENVGALVLNELNIFSAKAYYSVFPQQLDAILAKEKLVEDSRNEKKLTYYFSVAGPKKIFAKLHTETAKMTEYECHNHLHDVGRVFYRVYKDAVFSQGDTICGGAINHGAFEEYMDQGGINNLDKKINTICEGYKTDLDVWNCYHGVGHGIMGTLKWDLPKAVQLCNVLTNKVYRGKCYLGVFMDNNYTSDTKWIKANDAVYPCNESWIENSEQALFICYQNQIRSIMLAQQNSFEKTITFCNTVSAKTRTACYRAVSQEAAVLFWRDPIKLNNVCENVPEEYHTLCITMGVQRAVFFYEPQLVQLSKGFCNVVKEKDKRFCYSYIGRELPSVYSRTDKKEKSAVLLQKYKTICDEVTTKYNNICFEEAEKRIALNN